MLYMKKKTHTNFTNVEKLINKKKKKNVKALVLEQIIAAHELVIIILKKNLIDVQLFDITNKKI